MSLFGRDTRPEVVRVLIDGYRAMSAEAKLARVWDLSAAAQQLAEAGVRIRHPDATPREIRLRVAALSLGRQTMIRAFGWDPEREGW
jgi:hypothetical protein